MSLLIILLSTPLNLNSLLKFPDGKNYAFFSLEATLILLKAGLVNFQNIYNIILCKTHIEVNKAILPHTCSFKFLGDGSSKALKINSWLIVKMTQCDTSTQTWSQKVFWFDIKCGIELRVFLILRKASPSNTPLNNSKSVTAWYNYFTSPTNSCGGV